MSILKYTQAGRSAGRMGKIRFSATRKQKFLSKYLLEPALDKAEPIQIAAQHFALKNGLPLFPHFPRICIGSALSKNHLPHSTGVEEYLGKRNFQNPLRPFYCMEEYIGNAPDPSVRVTLLTSLYLPRFLCLDLFLRTVINFTRALGSGAFLEYMEEKKVSTQDQQTIIIFHIPPDGYICFRARCSHRGAGFPNLWLHPHPKEERISKFGNPFRLCGPPCRKKEKRISKWENGVLNVIRVRFSILGEFPV